MPATGADARQLLLQVDASVALAQRNLSSLAAQVQRDSQAMETSLGRPDQALERLSRRFKSAEASASIFTEYGRAADQLYASINPLYGAQLRYDEELARAQDLMRTGALTADRFAEIQLELRRRLEQTEVAFGRGGVSIGQYRAGAQQLSFQIGDVAQGLALGISPMTLFAQQAGQTIQAITLMKGEATGLISFLGGPWGAVITGAVTILGSLLFAHKNAADGAREQAVAEREAAAAQQAASRAADELARHQDDLASFFDRATGKIIEQNRVLIQNAILRRQDQLGQLSQQSQQRAGQAFALAHQAVAASGRVIGQRFVAERQPYANEYQFDPDLSRAVQSAATIFELNNNLTQLAARRPELRATVRQISDLASENILAGRSFQRLRDEIRSFQSGTLAPSLRTPPSGGGGGGGGGRRGGGSGDGAEAERQPTPAEVRLSDQSPYAFLSQPSVATMPDPEWVPTLEQMNQLADQFYATLGGPLPEIGHMLPPEEQARLERFGERFAHDLTDNLADAIVYGKSLGDALVDSIKRAASALLSSSLMTLLTGGSFGSTSIAQIFSGKGLGAFFGGFHAAGGTMMPGTWNIVGERGPEIVIPRTPATVIPNHVAFGGGGGGPVNISVTVNAKDAVLTQQVQTWIAQGIRMAAPAIAANGAGMALKTLGTRRL
jgi:hypothetical protein